ncbi:MAG TPA: glycosyltransferase family A protein [Pyrinomonadaceae bacterium]
MPKVSIIIATYNRARLLPRAVESARQAGSDVEIVVVDDASTDETPEVCRALSGVNYVRVERGQRLGGARNVGILASAGEFLAFLDDDDLRLPGSLDLQAEALAANPDAGLVYGQTVLGDQDCVPTGRVYPNPCPQGDIFWELLERNFIGCPSAMFRRSCLYRVGLPASDIPGIEDWDLWVRLAEMYPAVALERPVAIYRKATPGSGQFTSDAAAMVRRITAAHRERWMTLPRALAAPAARRRDVERRFSRNMATHLLWEAGRGVRHGNFRAARTSLLAALRLHPAALIHRATRPSNLLFILARARDLAAAR